MIIYLYSIMINNDLILSAENIKIFNHFYE